MHAPLILHRGCEAVRVVSVLCWQWHGNYHRSSAGHAHLRACRQISTLRTLSKPVLLLGETPLYQHVVASAPARQNMQRLHS